MNFIFKNKIDIFFVFIILSKLGITLTHRPRSSSVFFIYLCAVHILTIYLLFIRHC